MASFRSVIDSITGNSDLEQAEREALESLESLAKSKAESFEQQVQMSLYTAGDGRIDKTLPVSVVDRKYRQTRCYSSNDASKITTEVSESIKKFVGGSDNDVVDGVFGLLSSALTVFLGESSSQSDEMYDYFSYATPFGIYRVDTYAWYQTVTASTLKTKVQKATVYSYTHSIVDIASISWRDFVALYGVQLYNEDMTPQQITEARQQIAETWRYLFTDPAPVSSLNTIYQAPLVGGTTSLTGGAGGSINGAPNTRVALGRGPLSKCRELMENSRINRSEAVAARLNQNKASTQTVLPAEV